MIVSQYLPYIRHTLKELCIPLNKPSKRKQQNRSHGEDIKKKPKKKQKNNNNKTGVSLVVAGGITQDLTLILSTKKHQNKQNKQRKQNPSKNSSTTKEVERDSL